MYLTVSEFQEKIRDKSFVVWGLRKGENVPGFLSEVDNSFVYSNANLHMQRSLVEKELSDMANNMGITIIEIYPLSQRVSDRPHKTAIIDDFGYDGDSLERISIIAVQDAEDPDLIDVIYEKEEAL